MKPAATLVNRYVPKVEVNKPCTICGSTDSSLLFETEFKRFNYNGEFFMRTCGGCGLRFASPRLTEADIALLYGENYYVFAKSDQDYFARTAEIYDRTIKLLDLGPGLSKRMAEVGSGKGYLLAVLKKLGWETFGIEISSSAAEYSRKTFGIDCFIGTIEDYFNSDQQREPFAAVLCIDIIEHVTAPDRFVERLSRLTAKGGSLIIDTPNGGAKHIETERGDWRGFNPFHIYLFNAQNLARLLEKHGFKVVRSYTYNNFMTRRKDGFTYARNWMNRLLDRKPSAVGTLEACVEACGVHGQGYDRTKDAAGELAEGVRGENLVVFAERV